LLGHSLGAHETTRAAQGSQGRPRLRLTLTGPRA
jgi:hypothetical protein